MDLPHLTQEILRVMMTCLGRRCGMPACGSSGGRSVRRLNSWRNTLGRRGALPHGLLVKRRPARRGPSRSHPLPSDPCPLLEVDQRYTPPPDSTCTRLTDLLKFFHPPRASHFNFRTFDRWQYHLNCVFSRPCHPSIPNSQCWSKVSGVCFPALPYDVGKGVREVFT